MSYIKTVSESFWEEYQEQLSWAIITEMELRFDIKEEIAAINKEYELELAEQVSKMTEDEIDAAWTELKPRTVQYKTAEEKFNFCLTLMQKRGMTVTHEIDKKWNVTIRTFDMVSEAKYKTKASYDISVEMLERNEVEK